MVYMLVIENDDNLSPVVISISILIKPIQLFVRVQFLSNFASTFLKSVFVGGEGGIIPNDNLFLTPKY